MVWPDDYLIPGIKPFHQEEAGIIYCADCRDILPKLPKVDLVLTDPPYGVKRDEGFEGFGGFGEKIARRRYIGSWDKDRLPKDTILAILAAGQSVIMFGGNYYADILPVGKHWLVWDKLNTMPTFGDCELAWTNIKRQSVKKITREYNGLLGKEGDRFHPTQKPLNLFKNIIAIYSQGDAIVGDFCLGGGTTAVAAKELGRKFIGIEISPEYCAIAVKRLRQNVLNFGIGS